MDKIKEIILQVESLKNDQKFNEAIEILQNAITTYYSDYRLYEELGDIYLYRWELNKWMKAVNFALKLNPESATWNYLKWFILLSKDKIKEAIIFLEKSNKLMWNNSEVLRNLWWAYSMIWDSVRWIAILKRALTMAPWDDLITEDLAMALIWIWEISEWNWLLKKIWKKIIA